jgi:hypothetical protein
MKKLIFLFLISYTFSHSFGQGSKSYMYTGKYTNGQLKEKGYQVITGISPPNADTTKKNVLYAATSKRVGLWEFWYENGNKKLEILYNEAPHYINMWLADGTPILKNGNGYYSCYKNEYRNDDFSSEKLVFVVKDSVLTKVQKMLEKPPYVK